MALTRGVIRKGAELASAKTLLDGKTDEMPFVLPKERAEAIRDAERIVDEAKREAREIVAKARTEASSAREEAMRLGREEGAASLAASALRLRAAEARFVSERDSDVIDVARALAERLLGHALELDPSVIVDLARQALRTAGRSRRIRLFVHPDDAHALSAGLGDLELAAAPEIQPDPSLARGSLRAETDLGILDGSIPLQLDRLVAALKK